MRHYWQPLIVILIALLVVPARAQHESVHWHSDLESARIVAKETGRLVLIHFWTPSCQPCLALDQTVFNQPGVASAIETQCVPVKLNADENSATAQLYDIRRVPTDVVVTPDGQVVGKMVSPPTPAAYVAEVTSLARKYATRSGQVYAGAAAVAPISRNSIRPTPGCKCHRIRRSQSLRRQSVRIAIAIRWRRLAWVRRLWGPATPWRTQQRHSHRHRISPRFQWEPRLRTLPPAKRFQVSWPPGR